MLPLAYIAYTNSPYNAIASHILFSFVLVGNAKRSTASGGCVRVRACERSLRPSSSSPPPPPPPSSPPPPPHRRHRAHVRSVLSKSRSAVKSFVSTVFDHIVNSIHFVNIAAAFVPPAVSKKCFPYPISKSNETIGTTHRSPIRFIYTECVRVVVCSCKERTGQFLAVYFLFFPFSLGGNKSLFEFFGGSNQ